MKWQNIAGGFVTCCLILLNPQISLAKTLKVPQEFNSINLALKAASSGDEVIVAPGTYKGSISLKNGVILRSQGSDKEHSDFTSANRTIIQGSRDQKQIVLGANDAVLDGFTLQSIKVELETQTEERGISINGTTTTITNCIIAYLPYTGIEINSNNSNKVSFIKNNKIFDNKGNCISCNQETVVHIEGNKIYQNTKSGIENHKKSKPKILRNTIFENDIDGIMNTHAEPIIEENIIRENGLNGIGLQQKSNGQIKHNKISGNRQAGIGLRSQAEGIISSNSISGNMIGIGLMAIKEAVIESNKINGNNIGIGLIRCEGGKVILRKNNLRGNIIIPISPNKGCELIKEDNKT